MNFFVTLNQTFVLFLLLLIGFLIRKLNIVDASFSKNLSGLLFNIIIPAMIIYSMNYPFTIERLIQSGWLVIISVVVLIVSGIIGILVFGLIEKDALSRNIYEFGMIFSNFGYMGFPLSEAVFGRDSIFYTAVFTMPLYIAVNSYGVMMIKRGKDKFVKMDLKHVVNPPIVAVFIGFLLFLFSIELPKPIFMTVEMIANTTTPLSMILAGILLANGRFVEMFANGKVYLASFIRLLVLPLLMLFMLKLFTNDRYMIGIPVIITAMPIAANCSILAEQYDGDAYLGAQCVFISTLFSILTIPLIALLL
mgnify:CR=1 FL=1